MQPKLPTKIAEFLVQRIDSIEQLEILLLLRENRSREWTIDEIDQVIRSSSESISNRVNSLCLENLVIRVDGITTSYKYSPSDNHLESIVTELAAVYRDKRTRVIETIYSKPAHAIKSFSDAFKFKKDE